MSEPEETNWEDAAEQCQRILDKCDDVPEAGEDFADSVREKVESIQAWIEDHESVTEKQLDALDNMEAGLDRWMR